MQSTGSSRYITAIAATAVFAVACIDPADPDPIISPLAGLVASEPNDTSAATPPPSNSDPGYFRGTVMAAAPAGSGPDTLATKPRIANVTVSIYPRIGSELPPEAGAEAGSVVTGADGLFQLPTLPAGEYVVTFVPPAGGPYHGVYAFGPLNGSSKDYPWWVTLPLR